MDEAAALNYAYQKNDIYSCSWGPPDDGRSMDAPGLLIEKAMVNGIQNGRGGKGSVFVFASGNGGSHGDQCNFDGYTNSIYSVTVASIDYKVSSLDVLLLGILAESLLLGRTSTVLRGVRSKPCHDIQLRHQP